MSIYKQELVICRIKQREAHWQNWKVPNSLPKLLGYCLNLIKSRPVTGWPPPDGSLLWLLQASWEEARGFLFKGEALRKESRVVPAAGGTCLLNCLGGQNLCWHFTFSLVTVVTMMERFLGTVKFSSGTPVSVEGPPHFLGAPGDPLTAFPSQSQCYCWQIKIQKRQRLTW